MSVLGVSLAAYDVYFVLHGFVIIIVAVLLTVHTQPALQGRLIAGDYENYQHSLAMLVMQPL